MLKAQDIFVLLKLVGMGSRPWAYANLAVELGMSPSQLHSAIKRALAAQLAIRQGERIVPNFRISKNFASMALNMFFGPNRVK